MTGYIPHTERHGPAPEFVPGHTPTFTLERHIASLRDRDPVRWAQLNAEWADPDFHPWADPVGRDAMEGVER